MGGFPESRWLGFGAKIRRRESQDNGVFVILVDAIASHVSIKYEFGATLRYFSDPNLTLVLILMP